MEDEKHQEISNLALSGLREAHEFVSILQAIRDLASTQASCRDEQAAQVSILRDMFAPPAQLSLIQVSWLAWNDAFIPKLAQSVYENGGSEDMPILGDALEEAGCTDSTILEHFRGRGPHVRGCWALDLILGKQ